MIKEYWITWAYSDIPGHVQSSSCYSSEDERQEAIKNPHRDDIFVSDTFECDHKGDVLPSRKRIF